MRAAEKKIEEQEATLAKFKREYNEMKREYNKREGKTIRKVESGKKRKN